MMRRVFGMLAAVFLSFLGLAPAQAGVQVRVDLSAQRMQVTTSDGEVHNWAISSGRTGYRSPTGTYRPIRLERRWYSRKYGGSMPHAVFFRGGFAIHGTTAVGALGRPASHGCIRLHPTNAATLFGLVKKHGADATQIALSGAVPDSRSQFAGSNAGRAKLAHAKAKRSAAAMQARVRSQGGPSWGDARNQLMLRPTVPPTAFGYQPYLRDVSSR